MTDFATLSRNVRYRVDLPGGQRRLKEAALYIMQQARDFEYFGLVKLNKMLWRADFQSFRARGTPVTGRQYQKLERGPAPVEMLPLLNEMQNDGAVELVSTDIPNERRPVAKVPPVLNDFSPNDVTFLDEALEYYRPMTAAETSEESHGLAWKTREIGDPIPYESVMFLDEPLPQGLEHRLKWLARDRAWRTE